MTPELRKEQDYWLKEMRKPGYLIRSHIETLEILERAGEDRSEQIRELKTKLKEKYGLDWKPLNLFSR